MKWLKSFFDEDSDWYAPAAIAIGLYTLYQAANVNRWTIAGWPRPMVLAAVFGLIFAICKYAKIPGARWWGIPWVVFLVVGQGINASLANWSLWRIVGLLAMITMCLGFAATYFTEWFGSGDVEEDESDEKKDKPFLSLVLLFRESPFLDAAVLSRLASKAWDIPVSNASSEDDESGEEEADLEHSAFIVGDAPLFIVKHPAAFVMVHHFDRPYFDDSAAAAEDIVERRVQRAVAEHQAWTAVDVVTWLGDDENPDAAAYRLVARLLAELADDNVLAVFDPAEGRLFAYDPETERKLRSDDPLAELREPYYSPVISVPDEDPAMIAAVAEARQRWPEFVTAFENRSPEGPPFLIKAPVGPEGDEEFIWIEVTGIESDIIYGALGNEPAAIPNLKMGDRVRIPLAKLNDWFCAINGKQAGGFTLKVIADHARRNRKDESGADE
jgi:uncharacterized protein YegJ (DUF2314 family)